MLTDTDLKILNRNGFSDPSPRFVSEALPTVYLQFLHEIHPESASESRFGGKAVLPKDAEWPKIEGKPLDFIALLNLSQLECDLTGLNFPDNGFLCFFCDFGKYYNHQDYLRWRESARIIYSPSAVDLEFRDHPIAEPNSKFYLGTSSHVRARRLFSIVDGSTVLEANGWDINADIAEKLEEYYQGITVEAPADFALFPKISNSSYGQLGGFPQYCQLGTPHFPESMVNPRLVFHFQDGANGNWFIFCPESEISTRQFRNCCLYLDHD